MELDSGNNVAHPEAPEKSGETRKIGVEPALFLYMISAFIRFPAFQALIYEMVCYQTYPDSQICSNSSATRRDSVIQEGSNHVLLASNLVLTLPSIVTSLVLGSVSDRHSRKLALLIPFLGLVLSDFVYIAVTSLNFQVSPYWLLLSDAIFGVSGGFIGVLGTMFAYGAAQSDSNTRSYRMAILEGSIGAGGTIGYLISGHLIHLMSYRYLFLIVCAINALCFHCLILFTSPYSAKTQFGEEHDTTLLIRAWSHVKSAINVAFKRRDQSNRACLLLLLGAIAISFIVFSGSSDILFYYMKFKLGWSTIEYGNFSAIVFCAGTLAILIIYPCLRRWCFSDYDLAVFGMISKAVGCVMLAFVFANWFAFTISIVYCLNRFASASLRSLLSQVVNENELGQVFALVSLVQGICTMIASSLFNTLLPASLHFFPGLSFILMSLLLCIAIVCVYIVKFIRNSHVLCEWWW